MAELTAEFFNGGAHDPLLGERLALAQTTVHIHFSDEAGVTLDLTKAPINAEPRIIGTAEVELFGTPELFVEMVNRQKQMAMAITRGELAYEGPVRKFLRIVPIMRSLDFSMWAELRPDRPNGAAPSESD
ncbi:SCP2 sterol-binding domain-containing protein [Paraconexibacter sp.]|uniref:SCP2 sterol-binding domain-containing protein n=1 Tax=Paraconexibacter sp. TaxID=2949640 RepID=UPI003563E0B7